MSCYGAVSLEDILEDLTELTEQVYTKSHNGGWPIYLKFYEPGTNLKNNLKFSKLSKVYFSSVLEWWECIGFLSRVFKS